MNNTSNTSTQNENKNESIIDKKDSMKCIECGCDIDNTYEIFCGQFIRLLRCPKCGKVADKYIEYDNVLVFLDMLLQKRPVYRHLLFNHDESINGFFIKLFFGSLLLESYIRQMTTLTPSIYSFIWNGIQIVIEDIIFLAMFIIPFSFYKRISFKDSCNLVAQSYLIGSLGKVFLCLVLMWTNSLPIYLFSITMANLTFIACMSVVFEISTWKMLIIGFVIGIIYTIITSQFFPLTPLTYYIKNKRLLDLLIGDLYTF
ncbi:hypothetical protein ENUP19_0118G0039 [Entamoeba nuttalli]|uniref:Protein ARV n=1 Tax=Entamoeba nuttalli TaxID=412467 RepID=A0ABQ0DID1_9EUKA